MKALRLTTILALAACLSLLLCVAPLTDTAYATETSLEADDTHTFTHTLETYGDEQAHVYDFFNDKAFDYGSITKTFRLPDSYTVAIEPNEQSIISAVLQIVELSAENGVTINLNKAEDDYDWTYFSASIDVNGLERDLTFGYSANKFIEPPLNANYEGAHQYGFFRDYSIDDENDVYFSEYDRWLDTATISASDSFLITGKLSVHLADTEGIRHILVFNYDALEMKPIGDGSLIALDSYYSMESSSLSDTTPPGVNLDVRPVGRVFSTDTEESCYIVPSLLYDLPDENYSLTFIYNGTAGIAGSDYSLYISETPDEPYTIQARLDFSTVDGKEHTLFTNTITVRRHTVELRIDGTDDYRVGVNQAHDYSFVFDNNDVPDANVFAEWIFDRSGKYFDSDNVDELDAEDYSVVSDKRVVAESFTATGERLIALNLEITCNDGHENIGI